jgi:hypothetical protein
MTRKKQELIPVVGNSQPAVDLKFIPLVTLNYESTLELKPIPAAKARPGKARPGKARPSKSKSRLPRAKKGA